MVKLVSDKPNKLEFHDKETYVMQEEKPTEL
jgi:hypothetical protein